MKSSNVATKIWYIVYPLLFYYAVVLITMTVAQWILGSGNEQYVICQLIATVVAIPCMLPFYRQDQALKGISVGKPKVDKCKLLHGLWAAIIVICISVACNNLISMTPLVELSEGFKEANAGFYGGTLVAELISSAIATPFLEELVFRGIVFGRLKSMLPKPAAILISAVCFAIMHFNIVQFLYALLIGIVLSLLVEKAEGLYVAVVGHVAANALAVVRTETGFLAETVDHSVFAWVSSVIVLLVGIALLVGYMRMDVSKYAEKTLQSLIDVLRSE